MTHPISAALQKFYDYVTNHFPPARFIALMKSMPDTHPLDHKFEASGIPGVCGHCGHIELFAQVDPGKDETLLRTVAKDLASDLQTGFEPNS